MGADRAPAKPDFGGLLSSLKEIEELLQFPGVPGHIDKANALALRIARAAGSGLISNLAMRVISEAVKLRGTSGDRKDLNHALWHLRIALQEAKSST
jgi:hypothetical protein